MKQTSTFRSICTLIGFFVIAGLLIRIAFALIGGMIYLGITLGIPLVLAIFVVRYLTSHPKRTRNNHR